MKTFFTLCIAYLLIAERDALAQQTHLWAVGESGRIARSTDLGENWITLTSPTTGNLTGVDFVDFQHGWASGAGLYRTDDGGDSWRAASAGITGYLFGVDFVDESHGWAFGNDGIFATTNGGTNWTRQYSGQIQGGMHFIDRDHGWAVTPAPQTILRTVDGGQNWQVVDDHFPPFGTPWGGTAVYARSESDVWVSGRGHTVLHSQDGGVTFDEQHRRPAVGSSSLESIVMLTETEGWAVGEAASGVPSVYHTLNGGQSWELTTFPRLPFQMDLWDLAFTDRNTGWVVGKAYSILHTRDGGQTWELQSVDDENITPNYFGIAMYTVVPEPSGIHLLLGAIAFAVLSYKLRN